MKSKNLDKLLVKSRTVDEWLCYGSKFERQQKAPNLSDKVFHFSNQKEEEIEKLLRKKYADSEHQARSHFGDGGEEMSDEITQQTLLPGIK